jgi:FMN phosphatase YigB (HAD superfamily)
LGLAPGEAVFVDDQSENVEAAQTLGMAGLHYRQGMDVPAQLAGLGVQV